MQPTSPVSNASLWTGRILSALMVLFLIFDGVIHILKIAPVVKAFSDLGLPVDIAMPIGIIELICVLLYIVPRTSVLGAVLLTGYLGGAVLTQVRVGSPLFAVSLFPVYVGVASGQDCSCAIALCKRSSLFVPNFALRTKWR